MRIRRAPLTVFLIALVLRLVWVVHANDAVKATDPHRDLAAGADRLSTYDVAVGRHRAP